MFKKKKTIVVSQPKPSPVKATTPPPVVKALPPLPVLLSMKQEDVPTLYKLLSIAEAGLVPADVKALADKIRAQL